MYKPILLYKTNVNYLLFESYFIQITTPLNLKRFYKLEESYESYENHYIQFCTNH